MTHISMLVADSKEWQKRAKQCLKRAYTQQRQEFREDNKRRSDIYISMLNLIGVTVFPDHDEILVFNEPSSYVLLTKDVVGQIEKLKSELDQIGRERRVGE